jgi:hypothetical protein
MAILKDKIPDWQPSGGEFEIFYDPKQEELYAEQHPDSIYPQWPLRDGRYKGSTSYEFPAMIVAKYYRDLGYTVWYSEPRIPNDETFILLHFAGYRKGSRPELKGRPHKSFERMKDMFGENIIEKVVKLANAEKKEKYDLTPDGGDPDLFVFKHDGQQERFFVEVKKDDELNDKQKISFPIIESYLCEVKIARVKPRNG